MKAFYYWMIANLGINPRTTFSFFINLPQFFREYFIIKRKYPGRVSFNPYLVDRASGAGSFMHEYFVQDVFAAQLVHRLNPVKVVDVGSRIDGYIGHLISFRKVELIDIRPMTSEVPNLSFLQMNFSDGVNVKEGYTDFISCLHSIEHFGLGRYGDPLDLNAVPAALNNFHKMLKEGGSFLLSTTFGKEHIQFNKQWIFDIKKMVAQLTQTGFDIRESYYLEDMKFIPGDINEIAAMADKRNVLVLMLCKRI